MNIKWAPLAGELLQNLLQDVLPRLFEISNDADGEDRGQSSEVEKRGSAQQQQHAQGYPTLTMGTFGLFYVPMFRAVYDCWVAIVGGHEVAVANATAAAATAASADDDEDGVEDDDENNDANGSGTGRGGRGRAGGRDEDADGDNGDVVKLEDDNHHDMYTGAGGGGGGGGRGAGGYGRSKVDASRNQNQQNRQQANKNVKKLIASEVLDLDEADFDVFKMAGEMMTLVSHYLNFIALIFNLYIFFIGYFQMHTL
jgi:hypothetical protein